MGATAAVESDAREVELDDVLRHVLEGTTTIAVVGMKNDPSEDACRIPKYMAERGYAVVPVNPKLDRALERPAYPDLRAVTEAGITVDVVNVFRASENVEGHVEDVLSMSPLPKTVWLQLGIHHGPSARRLREAGIDVIQDRCIMVDHRRLEDRLERRPVSSAVRASGASADARAPRDS